MPTTELAKTVVLSESAKTEVKDSRKAYAQSAVHPIKLGVSDKSMVPLVIESAHSQEIGGYSDT